MIKAIIFDFFGVIINDAFDSTYRRAGGDPDKDRDFIIEQLDKANRGSIDVSEFRQKICERLNISIEDYVKSISKDAQINNQLLALIEQLHKKYKTALLSNVNKGGLYSRIDKSVFDYHFDVVIASGDVGYIKPEPEIYKLTASRLGVAEDECIFIDDRKPYVDAAVDLGMKGIVYSDFEKFKTELMVYLTP